MEDLLINSSQFITTTIISIINLIKLTNNNQIYKSKRVITSMMRSIANNSEICIMIYN